MPPNTLFTAQWAKQHEALALEYDVAIAKTDTGFEVFLIEPALLTQAGLDINNLNWQDVKALNTGNEESGELHPALLADALEQIGPELAHQVQIKGQHPESVKEVLKRVEGFENFIITAFDMNVIKEIKSLSPTTRVGWLVKPAQEAGDEAGVDLTAKLVAEADTLEQYSDEEIADIIAECTQNNIDIALICGPRIQSQAIVNAFHDAGLEVGAWGVAMNLELARRLMGYGLDRFTLDNPEQL